MTQNAFYSLFVDELKDIFDAENQIIQNLPKVIKATTNKELKEALTQHLDETKNQVVRLKTIFKSLNENPTGKVCKAMQGLFSEGEEMLKKNDPPAVKDVGIILACQKVEHYEISAYGSLRAIAHHLNDSNLDDRIDFDEIADLLDETLSEEGEADVKLTDIAEGGFFSSGINEEAQKEEESKKSETMKSGKTKTR